MANEVILEEYGGQLVTTGGQIAQIPGPLITSQVLDIAEKSAAFNAKTKFVCVSSKGTGFWWLLADSNASAAANTDGNTWVPADQHRYRAVGSHTHFDSAA